MKQLKAWMSEHGISQVQLASALKVSQPTVSDWLSGDTFPRPRKLLQVAAHTGIPVADLLAQLQPARKKRANA